MHAVEVKGVAKVSETFRVSGIRKGKEERLHHETLKAFRGIALGHRTSRMKSDSREELRICYTLSVSAFRKTENRETLTSRFPESSKPEAPFFLVRPVVIANDHMEEDKGRDGLR
jgi:hypothetical protein